MKTSVIFSLISLLSFHLNAQIAAGKCKFLGNIIASSIPSNFNNYWNQVTPENAGKWGSAESSRDVMKWTNLDLAYNHAKNSGFLFKWHTFIWGQQQPFWIASLSQADQKAEVEEWIQLFADRYPNTDLIDVVNEPLHAVPSYSEALGGAGETGWDWVVWSFEKARELFPNSKLILNDYAILGSNSNTDEYLIIINILKEKGLIDGIGVQGHGLETADTATLRANLDKLAATGIPIYVSEYDVNIANDAQQYQIYFQQFPLLWTHPGVAGITLWGYIQGQIWKTDAYLIKSNGTERTALVWLKNYVMTTNIECDATDIRTYGLNDNPGVRVYPNPATDGKITLEIKSGISELRILDINGRMVKNIPVHEQTLNLDLCASPGLYFLHFIGDQDSIIEKLYIE